MIIAEPRSDVIRDLLDDLRANPVQRDRHTNSDKRAERQQRVHRCGLPASRHNIAHVLYRSRGHRFASQPQGEDLHLNGLHGQSNSSSSPRTSNPLRGYEPQP